MGRGFSLDGRIAVVTGAARGIGLAVTERLLSDGARVVMGDLDLDRVREEAARLGPTAAIPMALDVADPESVSRVLSETLDQFGRVDVLVNNAGIAGRSAPIWELTDADWHTVLSIDLTGVFYCCRAVVPHMRQRGYGRIVNIASIAGKEGNPNAVPYSSAKAGVIGLTKALAKEVVREGILVNAVAPAVIQTDILRQASAEHVEYMISKIPMGRVGQPREVAALVAWLASDDCSFSTGAVYDISGGRATY